MRRIHTFLNPALVLALLTAAFAAPAEAATNSYWRTVEYPASAYDSPYRIGLFAPENGEDGARLRSQVASTFAYGLGMLTLLYALPEDSTGWTEDGCPFSRWKEHIKRAPEWDRNKWGWNYAGHAYIGGMYYQTARKSGYRQWDSFVYSVLMSTFFWEFGIEATAEVPSVQDLVYTPVAGWLVGEWMYQTEQKVRANNNQVLNSSILGGLTLILLDPIDSAGRGVNRLTGRDWIRAGHGYITYAKQPGDSRTDHTVYLNYSMPIGVSGPSAETPTIKPGELIDDPVSTGIIGFSAGMGRTLLDSAWNVEDDLYTKLALGLYFTPRLSMRLAYAVGDLTDKTTGHEIDYETYSWDTQLYLFTKNRFRPYMTGGLGRQVWGEDNSTRTFQWNGGFGAHWQFYRKMSLNADWIGFYSPSHKTFDQQFSAGLTYRFGSGEHQDW